VSVPDQAVWLLENGFRAGMTGNCPPPHAGSLRKPAAGSNGRSARDAGQRVFAGFQVSKKAGKRKEVLAQPNIASTAFTALPQPRPREVRKRIRRERRASVEGFDALRNGIDAGNVGRGFRLVRAFRCSTSRFGIGQVQGSNRTPLGLHRVAEKIGGGWPAGAAFRSRRVVGFTWQGAPRATITGRILWLEGLEPGFNRGGRVDSHTRYIYIHGTGDEPGLGRPASCGCIHLAAADLIPLFDRLASGTLVWIGAR
jgi:hypothetical protein